LGPGDENTKHAAHEPLISRGAPCGRPIGRAIHWFSPLSPANVRDGLSNTFAVGEDVVVANHHSVAYYSNGDYASCHAPLNYFPQPPTPDHWPSVMSFRSLHPGGAHFCLADGSIHFVGETIDLTVYQALSTRAGRETVTLPQ